MKTRIPKSSPSGPDGLGPITLGEGPNNLVWLYTEADCTGPLAGEGTVETLKGSGILVNAPVLANSVTIFYAKQSDGIEDLRVLGGAAVPAGDDAPGRARLHLDRASFAREPELTPPDRQRRPGSHRLDLRERRLQRRRVRQRQRCAVRCRRDPGHRSPTTPKPPSRRGSTLAGFVSDCSGPVSYQEITPPPIPGDPGPGGDPGNGGGGGAPDAGPPAAPRLRTLPGGSANNNTPLVTGTAPGAGTVKIYATAECDGAARRQGLRGGVRRRPAGPRGRQRGGRLLRGRRSPASKASKCSDPVLYVEDSMTPRTRITMAPGREDGEAQGGDPLH